MTTWIAGALLFLTAGLAAQAQDAWVVYKGREGAGKGKRVVFVTGEGSYRSEESMPQMARILARHHGFTCTVLFAIDRKDGTINPRQVDNIPGLEALGSADLMVMFMRWRELPDGQMKHIVDYGNSGKAIIGIRNATHPFRYRTREDSRYSKYSWRSEDPQGGWGRMVFGETWVRHYGKNLVESTRCFAAEGRGDHPILRGVEKSFWLPDDVYGISTLGGDSKPLLMGQPLMGWKADDKPNAEKKPIPIAWTKTHTGTSGKAARVFTVTMGHGDVFKVAQFRRLLVNACYWGMGMEDRIKPDGNVDPVGTYDPAPVKGGGFKKGLKPSDFADR